ncbi:MAG: hypothetical protein Q4G16_07815 [Cruoricaptor ignavus]|nr:hypothetical protein [Cruoricaptor ignavus]
MEYDIEPGKYPDKKINDSDSIYVGNGWSVKREKDKYFLEYISGEMQGKLKVVEISEEDFLLAKEGNFDLCDFSIKYNIY